MAVCSLALPLLGIVLTTTSFALAAAEPAKTWALTGTRLYASPDKVIDNAVVLVRDAKIVVAGPRSKIRVPNGASISACSGGVITAGFQNSHVHFDPTRWNGVEKQPADALSRSLDELLLRYGFTTVVDTGSNPIETLALRRRITSGEVRGPRILTAGLPLYPLNGIPAYLQDLPPEVLNMLPQPGTAEETRELVQTSIEGGLDVTKLFVATPQRDGSIKRMDPQVARAAADATHRRGRLVFAHPTDFAGIAAAVAAGVDVLAHPALGAETPWPDALLRETVRARVALIPTLQLFPYELKRQKVAEDVSQRLVADAVEQVREFAAAGGQVLFGTDVGYMAEYDPTVEYQLLSKAGLSTAQILRALTTEPAARWRENDQRGRVEAGMRSDLVVLQGDPAEDPANFARVQCAFREGKEMFAAPRR
jgi:imidazolonepropionase-like amidohydrolase